MPALLTKPKPNDFTPTEDYEIRAKRHKEKVSQIYRERIELYQACEDNIQLQALSIATCKRDPIYFINYFVTTYDPRVDPSLIPFVLFERQEECVLWILERFARQEWGLVVKCRDTGLSWIFCAVYVWLLLFRDNSQVSLASNKASNVDKKNDKDCLFEKLVVLIRHLPGWLHDVDLDINRTEMLIINPHNGSSINGKSGENIGRGGRSYSTMCDEFAHIDADASAIAALSRNTDCAFYVSTPKGTANKFFEFYDKGEIPVFIYRWQSDPRRSPEWRKAQDLKLGEDIAAQELDCDFYAAAEAVYIKPKWVNACINAHKKIPELRRTGIRQAGLDVGAVKNDSILTIKDGQIVEEPIKLPKAEPTQTALHAHKRINKADVKHLVYDADGIGRDVDGALDLLTENQNYAVLRFHGAGATSDYYWEEHKKHSKELFANQRAEAWGYARWRILNTYNHISGKGVYKPEQMISLPDVLALKNDLSKPRLKYLGSKIRIESKLEMIARNVQSPDYADSFIYANYDLKTANWMDYC